MKKHSQAFVVRFVLRLLILAYISDGEFEFESYGVQFSHHTKANPYLNIDLHATRAKYVYLSSIQITDTLHIFDLPDLGSKDANTG